jgi:hypothetical protein
MVVCSIITPAVIAAALALPGGLILQGRIAHHHAAKAGFELPGSFVHVLGAANLTRPPYPGWASPPSAHPARPSGPPQPRPLPCAPNSHTCVAGRVLVSVSPGRAAPAPAQAGAEKDEVGQEHHHTDDEQEQQSLGDEANDAQGYRHDDDEQEQGHHGITSS